MRLKRFFAVFFSLNLLMTSVSNGFLPAFTTVKAEANTEITEEMEKLQYSEEMLINPESVIESSEEFYDVSENEVFTEDENYSSITIKSEEQVSYLSDETTVTEDSQTVTGSAGTNITFELNKETGLLTLSGTGNMKNGYSSNSSLFYEYREMIKSVVIGEGITSIGDYAFYKCKLMESISIPETVTSIGDHAFYECEKITSLELPSGITSINKYSFAYSGLTTMRIPECVTEIGESAFLECAALESVIIPEGVVVIGENVFEKCTLLKSIIFPESVEKLGESLFYGCTSLEEVKLPSQLTEISSGVFSGCTSLKSIDIPDGVTTIQTGAFCNCSLIESIVIPEGVTEIKVSTFKGCTALTKIDIPETVTTIENMAFRNCSALKEIKLPSNLQVIGDMDVDNYNAGVFMGCTSLKTVTIPANVTCIGDEVFKDCTELSEVIFESTSLNLGTDIFENTPYIAAVGDSVHVILNNTIYYKYNGKDSVVEIPEGVTSIAGGAFSGTDNLTSVTIPEGVIYLGRVFEYQKNLKEVKLSSTIEKIENNAFYGCSLLTSIELPDNLKEIGESSFEACSLLESVTFNSKLEIIEDNAFKDCTSLKSAILPDTLECIGAYCFGGCESLETAAAGDALLTVYSYAFEGTPFLENCTDEIVVLGNVMIKYKGEGERLVIPEGIVGIASSAAGSNVSLKQVVFPSTLKKIGARAFMTGSAGIKSFIFAGNVEIIENQALGYSLSAVTYGSINPYSITIYGYSGTAAEEYCSYKGYYFDHNQYFKFVDINQLKGSCGDTAQWSIDAPNGVLTISGYGAIDDYRTYNNKAPYSDYSNLIREITIGEGITRIGEYAFYNLSNVSAVNFSDTITQIGCYAFSKCSGISNILLPDSLSTIEEYAFLGLVDLTTVTLPENLTFIDSTAFLDTALNSFIISENNEHYMTLDGVLYSKDATELIAYPSLKYGTFFSVPDTVTYIGENAFYNNQYLTTILLGEAVSVVCDDVLEDCEALKKLIFCGDAPDISVESLNINGLTICCYFDKNGWNDIRESVGELSATITWIDLNAYNEVDYLDIQVFQTSLNVGDIIKLTPYINPILATEFIWSSNSDCVSVFADGSVMGTKPGTAVVTVSTPDGKYTADVTLEVVGEAFSMPSKTLVSLPANAITYNLIDSETMQIPCEKLNGIYFLNDRTLSFYSMVTGEFKTIENFEGCTNAFVSENLLYIAYRNQCIVYNLLTRSIVNQIYLNSFSMNAVGADAQGRIYIAACESNNSNSHRLFLYSADGKQQLDSIAVSAQIYCFSGFDATNGNFYVEEEYDWLAWHISHPSRALKCGNVTDGKIIFEENVVPISGSNIFGSIEEAIQGILNNADQFILCQTSYYQHRRSSAMLGNNMAVVMVPHHSFMMFNSNSYTCGDTENMVNFAIGREIPETPTDSTYNDLTTVGVRAVWNEKRKTALIYTENQKIVEYNLETGDKYAGYEASHHVFSMEMMGDTLILFEYDDDGQYYFEALSTKSADSSQVNVSEMGMKVGESTSVSLADVPYTIYKGWSSSDNSIASVTNQGTITAWKPGTAEISCAPFGGDTVAVIIVTVTENDVKMPENLLIKLEGVASNNASDNNYTVINDTVKSYMYENAQNGLTRVEAIDDEIHIENYSAQGEFISSQTLELPLPIFGGFYNGNDANYLLVGQKNIDQSDSAEVMRLLKYSKDWELISSLSFSGINTTVPFDAGLVSMTETDEKLYIHTSHEMYADSGGTNHQANMTFVINKADMTIADSNYEVSNNSTGYVSHSFNQFVVADETDIYRCDHGDAYPRAVMLSKCAKDGSIKDVTIKSAFNIRGYVGSNNTGVSVGGMTLSKENCLVVGNSVDMLGSTYNSSGQRNIFLSVTDKSLRDTSCVYLTSYTSDDNITPRTPQIVNLTQDAFLIMWEEYNNLNSTTRVRALTVDGEGNITQNAVEFENMRLSDCQPIMTSQGIVKWYVTENSAPDLHQVSPYDLSGSAQYYQSLSDKNTDPVVTTTPPASTDTTVTTVTTTQSTQNNTTPDGDILSGDITGDGNINLYDAIEICKYIMGMRTLTPEEELRADYDENKKVDLYDAIGIARLLLNNY